MKQQLLDIIEHTVFACDVEHVRICAEGAAHIHALRADKQVVVRGFCNAAPTNSYGIADNGELYSLLNNPNLSLVKQDNNLLTFNNVKTGNDIIYSFISEKRICELVPVIKPKYKFDFDAVANVPDNFVNKLKQQAEIAKTVDECWFEVESYINFRIGDWITAVQGNIFLPAEYPHRRRKFWDINKLIKVLSQPGQFKLGVSSNNMIAIECKTEYATYQYFLPSCCT